MKKNKGIIKNSVIIITGIVLLAAVITALFYFLYFQNNKKIDYQDPDEINIDRQYNDITEEKAEERGEEKKEEELIVIDENLIYIDPGTIDGINGGFGDGNEVAYSWKDGGRGLTKQLKEGDIIEFTAEFDNFKQVGYCSVVRYERAKEYSCSVPWKFKIENYGEREIYKIRVMQEGIDIITGVKNELPKKITVTNPQEEKTQITNNRYVLAGTNTDDVFRIRVIFKNVDAGLDDDYYLVKFKKGDTGWEYTADIRYQNLALGKNIYLVIAYNENEEELGRVNLEITANFVAGEKEAITIEWLPEPIQEDKNIDRYFIGQVTSGNYPGSKLYVELNSMMGGYDFMYYLKINSRLTGLEDLNVEISYDYAIPEKIKIPGTSYYLNKSNWGDRLFSDFHPIKVIATDDILGDIYLAYPKYLYQSFIDKKMDNIYSCAVAKLKNHKAQVYDLPLDFIKEEGVLDVVFNDGTVNLEAYNYTEMFGCGVSCRPFAEEMEKDLKPDQRLKIVGIAKQGEIFYEFKDINDEYLKNIYNNKYTVAYYYDGKLNEKSQYTYDEFIALRPVLYWKDPFGRWIRFKNKKFDILSEMCKPVIYLYPEKEIDIKVKVRPTGGFTYTNPEYNQGWLVRSSPQSEIRDLKTGIVYPYLYWEGIALNLIEPKKGFTVKKSELEVFFKEKLTALNFNEKEISDFNEYWVERLAGENHWFISFIDELTIDWLAPLEVYPQPDNVIRVLIYAKPAHFSKNIEEQVLVKKPRTGFSVIEWGGIVID